MHTFITPPSTSYFVHGFRTWDRFSSFQRFESEMSCSLQLDGHTDPFRPFGVIISVEEGGLIKGFDQDVASILVDGEKLFGHHSKAECLPQYREANLAELLENTIRYRHNELWIRTESVHVVGAYCVSDTYGVSGAKAFRKECLASGLILREIPTVAK